MNIMNTWKMNIPIEEEMFLIEEAIGKDCFFIVMHYYCDLLSFTEKEIFIDRKYDYKICEYGIEKVEKSWWNRYIKREYCQLYNFSSLSHEMHEYRIIDGEDFHSGSKGHINKVTELDDLNDVYKYTFRMRTPKENYEYYMENQIMGLVLLGVLDEDDIRKFVGFTQGYERGGGCYFKDEEEMKKYIANSEN